MDRDQALQGFAFPFRIDPRTGGVAATEGDRKLNENLQHLLQTNIGERVMRRQYGGGVRQLLHENINDGLIRVAQHQISKAILRYEPRVLPQEIRVIPKDSELFLRVRYIQANTPGVQTTIIPLQ